MGELIRIFPSEVNVVKIVTEEEARKNRDIWWEGIMRRSEEMRQLCESLLNKENK